MHGRACPENGMVITVMKLVLTPLLLAGSTLAARRWGPLVGGWIVGMPLTSGPVSVFLALEQGRDFAAASADGSLHGLLAVVAFCVTYDRCARRFSWPPAAMISLGIYFAAVALLADFVSPLWLSFTLVFTGVTLGLAVVRAVPGVGAVTAAPRWDLPFRMVAATSIVVIVTTVSQKLGPSLSGIFAAFPVFVCVMSVFSHHLNGAAAVRNFARGVIMGSYAYVAFFMVVALRVQSWNLALVYVAAILCAIVTNCIAYRVLALLRRGGALS